MENYFTSEGERKNECKFYDDYTNKFNIYLKSLCFQWISFAVCNPIRHSSWMEIQVYFLDVMNFINWIMKYDLSWNAKWVEIILKSDIFLFIKYIFTIHCDNFNNTIFSSWVLTFHSHSWLHAEKEKCK